MTSYDVNENEDEVLTPTWHQSMIRVRNITNSLNFYTNMLGMTLVDHIHFPQMKFSVYFLQTLAKSVDYSLTPGTQEAHQYVFNTPGVTLELTHNHGTESSSSFEGYHAGNAEGDGFGHLAYSVDDVYACCERLEQSGVQFKKRPDEGRMKGLAFALDPDGYWIEIVARHPTKLITHTPEFSLAQTMLRVKNPASSINFFQQHFDMTLIAERHWTPDQGNFSLYFLASLPTHIKKSALPLPTSNEASAFIKNTLYPSNIPVLELTHNHGTEAQDDFVYNNGNSPPDRRGFGHIGFLVTDIHKQIASMEAAGVSIVKRIDEGNIKGIAFARSPSGYMIEIIERGWQPNASS